jgi:L-alanine-DL-glutamate epimerase-like enolase superfamily enzyme
MKISYIKIYPLAIPLIEPMKMSGETITHANTLLVCIRDDEGREAWGETSAAPLMTGETIGSLLQNAKYLGEHLMGISIPNLHLITPTLNKFLYGNSSIKACFEMGLLDLFAQKSETSVWKILRNLANNNAQNTPNPLPLK